MPSLQNAIQTAARGERLHPDQAIALVTEADLHTLGELGLKRRTALYKDKAWYVYNQHLNYTNVCANNCRFCAFHKDSSDSQAFTMTIDQVRAEIQKRIHEPVTEIHITGGLNPDLPYSYYLDLLQAIGKERPTAVIKAFTAVEVAWLATQESKTTAEVLFDMKSAGLNMLPGGGAEVFSPALREKLCPEKLSGRDWLRIHEEAHAQRLYTNCTLLFGHIENWQQRLEHLEALRTLQDKTKGFLCFIPLQYQPHNNPLEASGTDGVDYLRMITVSRLFLDNIPHIKAYWAFSGIKSAQLALAAGADDFDGTIVEEKIGHAAGASSPRGMTVKKLRQSIETAGFIPVERTSFFKPV